MAKKCSGRWDVDLRFNGSTKVEHGKMIIKPETGDGDIEGDHFDDGNPTSKKLKGKCKDGKVSFRRPHKDGGVIIHTGEVKSDFLMEGDFEIVAGTSIDETEGGGSEKGGKDKDKDKEKDVGDTGTWTGSRDGLPNDKDKKPNKGGSGGGSGHSARQEPKK